MPHLAGRLFPWLVVAAGVVTGALVFFPGHLLVWPVALVSAVGLLLASYRRCDRDPLAPSVAFTCVYLAFFLVGSLNLYESASRQVLLQPIPSSIWLYVTLGLVAFLAGDRLGQRWSRRTRGESAFVDVSLGGLLAGSLACIGAGGVALIAVCRHYGVPVFDVDVRSEVSGYLSYLNCLIWAGLLLLAAYLAPQLKGLWTRRFLFAGAALLGAGTAILLAYRTPVVIVALTALFLYHILVQQIPTSRIALSFVVLSILGAQFAIMRSINLIGESSLHRFYLARTGMTVSEQALPFQALYWGIFRESVANLNVLLEVLPQQQPFLYGKALGGSLLSVLPGKQMTAREYVSLFIHGEVRTTLTPTVLGPFYIDFGVWGIAAGMAAIGFILGYLYARRRRSPLHALLYAFWLAIALASIHAGLSDPGYYLFLPAIFVGVTALSFLLARRLPPLGQSSAALEPLSTERPGGIRV